MLALSQHCGPMKIKCGSGLARDCGMPANKCVGWQALIAGKPAPTGTVLAQVLFHAGEG